MTVSHAKLIQDCGTNTHPDRNEYYTPSAALAYLDFLPDRLRVWEPCASEFDVLARRMRAKWPHWNVTATDISRGQDFLTWDPDFEFDMIITNPPYKNKMAFVKRALSFGKPVILLIPTMVLESGPFKRASQPHSLSIVLPYHKLHYIPKRLYLQDPDRDKWPLKDTESMLHTSWFCWDVEVPDVEDCMVLRTGT